MSKNKEVLSGNVYSVFLKYAIPNVLGLLALSSSMMIDGAFLGNFVGSEALASVNLVMPLWSLAFGVALMFTVGGSVRCGKYFGEASRTKASATFTQTITVVSLFGLFVLLVGKLFTEEIALLLGANDHLSGSVQDYLSVFFVFIPFLLCGYCLSAFVQLEGRPGFASFGLMVAAVLNVALDWFFIVVLELGVKGAALATGISQTILFLLMLTHFFSKQTGLHPVWKGQRWLDVLKSVYNGVSEFLSEISAGVVALLFNWIMIRRFGVDGVAAFTIINYLLFLGVMFFYGISEALQPTITQNFGARQHGRIKSFLSIAGLMVTAIGCLIVAVLFWIPDEAIALFLKEGEENTIKIASTFLSYFWPVFLVKGINIVISGYFTAMHKPAHSAALSLSSSLLLPVALLAILPQFLGDIGIFIAIPLAETVTFVLAVIFLAYNRPKQLVRMEYAMT